MVGIARTVMPTGPRFANANNWFACWSVISALLQLKSLTRKSLAVRRPRDKHPGPAALGPPHELCTLPSWFSELEEVRLFN
jgi:hypothetical protein